MTACRPFFTRGSFLIYLMWLVPAAWQRIKKVLSASALRWQQSCRASAGLFVRYISLALLKVKYLLHVCMWICWPAPLLLVPGSGPWTALVIPGLAWEAPPSDLTGLFIRYISLVLLALEYCAPAIRSPDQHHGQRSIFQDLLERLLPLTSLASLLAI